ncbi:GNAT family N-acetyltransferase [Pseudoalteromonas luteoviolacea]|uniref:GNAT family N-acetyltransferase n=1 Tax=Pseudoalteromonas luteoviolacea TaxID=43657 RepID=UPI001B37A088|nr:GNAT family N-acetyltransferase [Pseudoalteromonas luteoviolacea]MBQ4811100.1 GNAT family N-acetyltransferase [Pseudoalteromonas luteoviolacea]
MKIQEIKEENWPAILNIQNDAYHQIGPEELEVLKSKYSASPETCFVCVSNQNDVLGYLLAHPWHGTQPPKLFEPLPDTGNSDTLFLHDMAVNSQSKGKGIGRKMVKELIRVALQKRIKRITLVAVQGADSFWSMLDFTKVPRPTICPSYGENAVLMKRVLITQ